MTSAAFPPFAALGTPSLLAMAGRRGRPGMGRAAYGSHLFQELFQQVASLLGIALGAAVQAAQRLFVSSSRRPATVRGYGKFDHLINQVALVLFQHRASLRGAT